MTKFPQSVFGATCLALVLMGAGWESSTALERKPTDALASSGSVTNNVPGAAREQSAIEPEGESGPLEAAPMYHLNWWSVNGGGATKVNGTQYDLGLAAGEAVNGFVTGTRFDMGFGYWFGSGLCPIALSGDVNVNGLVSTSDIVYLVNFALKGGPAPLPCTANGDVNCNGAVSVSDIVVLVNKVLKAGPEPCNVCAIIPSLWSCP